MLSAECGKRHDKDTKEDETTDGECVSEVEDADVEEEDVGEWGELFYVQANIYWNFYLIHMYTIHVDLIKSHQKSHLSIALPVFFFFMIQQKYLRFWGNHFWADYRRWLAWPCWVGSMNGAFL